MIRCAVCNSKIKPPKRAWTTAPGGVNFYPTVGPGPAYAKELQRWAESIPFVHERCEASAPPGAVVALNLEYRLEAWRRAAR